mgnify:CR=1 FL=1
MENYTKEQVKEMIASGKKVVVDFWAEWCGPCRAFVPVFEEVAGEGNFSDVTFVKCNVDEDAELPAKYGIRSIPTIILFDGGTVKSKNTGAMSKNQFEAFLS